MGVELFFLERTVTGSDTGPRFCVTLSPSPFSFLVITKFSRELNFFAFFSPVDIRFLFCQLFGVVNRPQN